MWKLFAVFFMAGSPVLAQGPFDGYLKGKGILDLAPSFSWNTARQFEGPGGQLFDLPYRGSAISLFGEYGLTAQLDVIATAAVVFTETQGGLQDGGFYLKYRPVYRQLARGGKLGLLLAGGLSFPMADYEPVATAALGQKAVVAPLRVIAQWETAAGIFINFTGGYNWRFDKLQADDIALIRQQRPDYSPAVPADFTTWMVKIGFPARHYYLDAWLERQITRGGADFQSGVADLPQSYGVSYWQTGGTIFYSESGRNGVFLSGGYIFSGRNTSRIFRITVGGVVKIGRGLRA